ncbi:histidine phosphatase family protein [Schleiferilactobacillus harbinensis]|nr:histidine phosphatase family protein [Schleiferilactobacillus harbinensis]
MTQTLYLMRHGQTLFNAQHRIQGWCDSPLTEKGIAQAKIAADYFPDNGITLDAAYCSTAERASDTLELVTQLPYTRVKGLREWNFGAFEAQPEYLNPPLPYNDFFVRYGGESQDQVQDRLSKTITTIMAHDPSQHVLMVSHGGAIANFYRAWQQYEAIPFTGHFGNCCILTFTFDGQHFVLQAVFNPDFSELDAPHAQK